MSAFDQALRFVLSVEGGYVDNPNDPGGATNFGITQKTYDAWQDAHGATRQEVRWITMPVVAMIYEENYWKVAGCDSLAWPMNLIIFDTAVNNGYGIAQAVAQAADGLGPDAAIAVRRYVYRKLAANNPNLAGFLKGWMNRLDKLRREYQS